MGSYRGNCEIVEAKDELSPIRRPRPTRDQRPPLNRGPNKSLEDDIHKLFESVNLRTSKSLDLSEYRRNASKKPIRASGSHSPGIGFSEPVSLKQALRGLCISQAAETAAMKRLSTASPRVSEAGKITNLYRSSLGIEAGGYGCSPSEHGEHRTETSVIPKKSVSSVENLPRHHQDSVTRLTTQRSCSSPSSNVKPVTKSMGFGSGEAFPRPVQCVTDIVGTSVVDRGNTSCSSSQISHPHFQEAKTNPHIQTVHSSPHKPIPLNVEDVESRVCNDTTPASEVDKQFPETVCSPEEQKLVYTLAHDNINDSKPGTKATSGPIKDSSAPAMVANKASPKPKQKSRLQVVSSSGAVKSSKDVKTKRTAIRAIKPTRNKNLIIKKPKKVTVSTDGNSKPSYEINSRVDHGSEELICHRCKCSLNDTSTDSMKDPSSAASVKPLTVNAADSYSVGTGWEDGGAPVVKMCITSKFSEKGDISQSSKSSICDFSSSTTSLSEESSLSGSTCGNRPHMSKDTRWEEINHVKRHYGFLGLSHFNLLKKLGSGDIGTVYLAELIGTNCCFAIKVMDNEFLARRKKMPRAQTEREILRMLDHPFLPTLYTQFTSENLSCLVMEFCPGGDLHVLRQKQPGRYFPEQAARFYVAEILLALEYLHMLGIVYRDLKPENILVREDGHIMLTDFDLSLRCSVNPTLVKASSLGIEPPRISGPCAGSNCIDPFCAGPSYKVSCFSPRLLPATAKSRRVKADSVANTRLLPQLVVEPTEARSNSFVGTHEYLAPEIIKGEGHGSAVDWWTFGVFLYELLYGKTPFKGAGNEETLTNVVMQNLKFPDTPIVSFHARDLIRGLLVKEPENRLGTETGAAEIKRHPFFDGLNWALIRCAIPPQIPDVYESGSLQLAYQEKGNMFMECSGNGEDLEFELF